MIKITIENETGHENKSVETDGYILFYLEKDKIKSSGNIEMRALAPLILQAAMKKFGTRSDQ